MPVSRELGSRLAAACGSHQAPETLAAAFASVLDSARALWPRIAVDEGAVADRIGALVRSAPDAAAAIAALHPDIVLAEAAFSGDRHALVELDRLVHTAAERAALRGAPADDLGQRVREQLLFSDGGRVAKITQYSGKGPLGAWLRVLVTRMGLTMQRGENRRTSKLADDELLASAPAMDSSPELQMLRAAYAGPFRDAFREALKALPPEDRNMLRLHLVDGLGIDRLAPMYGVHRATAARRLLRTKEAVLAKTRELLQMKLGIGESDFTSLVGLMMSRVEVSESFLYSTQRGGLGGGERS
jgi:RNA polymerase sigma-70 factor (ECF subfamily)